MTGNRKLKVLLVHLANPVIVEAEYHHGPTYIPLQAGYLKAAAYAAGLLSQVDIEILDRHSAYIASDAVLIDAVVARQPDVIGFTLYNCSSARSLFIAEEVKKRVPGITVIVGGPDVSPDHAFVVDHPAVDVGCIGEGEHVFVELLRNILARRNDHANIRGIFYRQGNRVIVTPPRPVMRDLDRIPSPFLLDLVPVKGYTCHFLMASRGCWSRCSYCGQGSRPWVHYSIGRVLKEIACLKKAGATYITFFDSNFIDNRFYRDLLRAIGRCNRDKSLAFNCFVYADRVDEGFADLLKDANFVNVQTGLQSGNLPTLRAVGRRQDREKFLRGIALLRDRNIAPLGVDLITGLPKETFSSFKRTLRFFNDNRVRPNIYRLHVYPGTKLNRDARRFGITHHKRPPYFVIRTGSFSRRELNAADRLNRFPALARHFNFSTYCHFGFSSARPGEHGAAGVPDRINKLIIEADSRVQTTVPLAAWGERLRKKTCQQFTLWFRMKDPGSDLSLLESFLRPVRDANPHINLKVILETGRDLPRGFPGKLVSRILDGVPPGFGRHLFCVLVPWDRQRNAPAALPGAGMHIPRCLSVDIPPDPRYRDDLDAIFGAKGFSELVFDFMPGCGRDIIVGALRSIADKSQIYGKPVSFRNMAFNHCGIVPMSADKMFVGSIVTLDRTMRIGRVLEPGRRLHLDLLSWRLTVQKALAVGTGAF